MKLTAEKIQSNWVDFMSNINTYISSPRKEQLAKFYETYAERIMLMPAAHKKEYHSAFPGGYVDHVNEELVFSAINHDLGKMGDADHEAYIPQTDKWRKDKLGEDYMFNKKLAFSAVPDRGLFLLQDNNIKYTFNEMLAIQTHDGLYDSANDKYLKGWMPEQKPRTSLPFILHQADMMAARIEFEIEWLPKFKNPTPPKKDNFSIKSNKSTKSKALGNLSSPGLKNMLDNL